MNWQKTPGKLILSGEHSVIYQQPALAVAVNKLVKSKITANNSAIISIYSHDQDQQKHVPVSELQTQYTVIQNNYQAFLNNELPISKVCSHESDLIIYLITHVINYFQLTVQQGFDLQINSDIPMGCGMGSSAAIILNVLKSLMNYFELSLCDHKLLSMAQSIENLCHGHSSGFDLRTIYSKKCLLLNNKGYSTTDLNLEHFSIVNTGKPNSSTGSCVSHVQSYLKNSTLLTEFKETTLALYHALRTENKQKTHQLIQKNHRLLVKIGIVPKTIQKWIHQLEQTGASAKICGAGSITGDKAGYCLIYGGSNNTKALLQASHYQVEPLTLFKY